ncbi:SPOSA6832_00397, partial [Sporobolomyces salmonicolor]
MLNGLANIQPRHSSLQALHPHTRVPCSLIHHPLDRPRQPIPTSDDLASSEVRPCYRPRAIEPRRTVPASNTFRGTAPLSSPERLVPQLLITCVTPTSHAIPINPFLPPSAFLSALPSFIRKPARPASTLWQSSTGMLRAIKLARQRLVDGALAGAGGEGRAQLPKYVVVISGTDVENAPGDEFWPEDDEGEDKWESVAKTFTRGQHLTTLFSLISLGSTPNLEAFWQASSAKFPPHLIYNSTAQTPAPGLNFPLLSTSHACFLIGFHNANRPTQQPTAAASTSQPVQGATPTSSTKRPAPSSPIVSTATKKSKANPPSVPPSTSPPQPAAAFLTGNAISKQQPTPPNSFRSSVQPPTTIQQSPLQRTNSPAMLALPGGLTNESLQQYINDMKASAARAGQPPPTAQDIQAAAMTAYTNAQRSGSTGTQLQPLPQVTPRSTSASLPQQQQQAQQTPPQLNQAQINALPPIPADTKAKIEAHLNTIRQRVTSGAMSQEEAATQVRRLQDLANQCVFCCIGELAERANALANQGQGLGLNIPIAPPQRPHSRQPSLQPPAPNPATLPQQNLPQPPQPARRDSSDGNRPRTIWRGAISWAFNEGSGARSEYTMYCSAAPMQASAVRDLYVSGVSFLLENGTSLTSGSNVYSADVKLPTSFKISSLTQIKMQALQELANKHTLPAISIVPIPSSALPQELRDRQGSQHNNEALYTMFAQSMEHRSNCGVVRFPGTPNGLVLVAVPKQDKLLGIVFSKIALPAEWAQQPGTSSSSTPSTGPRSRSSSQQQPQPQPPQVVGLPSAQS